MGEWKKFAATTYCGNEIAAHDFTSGHHVTPRDWNSNVFVSVWRPLCSIPLNLKTEQNSKIIKKKYCTICFFLSFFLICQNPKDEMHKLNTDMRTAIYPMQSHVWNFSNSLIVRLNRRPITRMESTDCAIAHWNIRFVKPLHILLDLNSKKISEYFRNFILDCIV